MGLIPLITVKKNFIPRKESNYNLIEEKLPTDVKETNRQVIEGKLKLLDIYYQVIRNKYPTLKDTVQNYLLTRFENYARYGSPSRKKEELFDGKRAMMIRKTQGQTRKELISSVELGFDQLALYKYETGRLYPLRKSKTTTKKYFEWLKQQGYDVLKEIEEKSRS